MQLSMSCGLSQRLEQKMCLRQMFGETSGDIPLYSLHRIANLLQKRPIRLAAPFVRILNRSLIAANAVYRQESGNKWNCLTSHNLVDAIERVDAKLAEIMTVEKFKRPGDTEPDDEWWQILEEERGKYVKKIQKWFEENYDDLLYIMDGKIPWPIIKRLQQNLATWIRGVINPFSENIEEMVLMVAKSEGVITDNPETAWEAMGGQVFHKKEKEQK